jgi:hypothetical protein
MPLIPGETLQFLAQSADEIEEDGCERHGRGRVAEQAGRGPGGRQAPVGGAGERR